MQARCDGDGDGRGPLPDPTPAATRPRTCVLHDACQGWAGLGHDCAHRGMYRVAIAAISPGPSGGSEQTVIFYPFPRAVTPATHNWLRLEVAVV